MKSKRICCNEYLMKSYWLSQESENYNCDYIIYKRISNIDNTIKVNNNYY